MRKLIILSILLITVSMSLNLEPAETAINDYNQTKQSLQMVFAKSDKTINELAKIVSELQKEIEELKKVSE